MRHVLSFVLFAALPLAALAPRAEAEGDAGSSCIHSWAEARYGALAYNHVVHVADSCDKAAECIVSTDVSPEPQKVEVPAKTEIEVVTFLGSPARTFTPRVACVLVH